MTDATTDASGTEPPYGVPDQPCADFGPIPAVVGSNAVELVADSGPFEPTCEGAGSGRLYAFTAPAEGDYEFSVIDADFDNPTLSLYGFSCWEWEVFNCALPPESIVVPVFEGETVHLVVDSSEPSTSGTATLTIVQQ